MANLPFAFFNLGAQEMIILLVLALVALGVAITIFLGTGKKNKDD